MRRAALALAALVSVVAGCGDDRGGSDVSADVVFSDTPEPTLDQVCDLRARACCVLSLCLSGSTATTQCIKVQQDACTGEIIRPLGAISGDVDYDPKRAGACLQHYLEAEGSCEELDTENVPEDCAQVFIGRVGEGGACATDIACKPGLTCHPGVDGECPGTCARLAALGEACSPAALCGAGLVCTSRSGEGSCVAATVGEGEACAPTVYGQCPRSQTCDPTTARCVARTAEGEACGEHGGGDPCVAGTYCDFTTRKCLHLPQRGEPCELTCGGESACDSASHTCVPLPAAPGEPCVGPSKTCGFSHGLYCDTATTTCAKRLPEGAPCGAELGTDICDFGWCDGDFQTRGRCRPFKSAGAACDDAAECGPLACDDGKCRLAVSSCRGVARLDQCFN